MKLVNVQLNTLKDRTLFCVSKVQVGVIFAAGPHNTVASAGPLSEPEEEAAPDGAEPDGGHSQMEKADAHE